MGIQIAQSVRETSTDSASAINVKQDSVLLRVPLSISNIAHGYFCQRVNVIPSQCSNLLCVISIEHVNVHTDMVLTITCLSVFKIINTYLTGMYYPVPG